MDGLLISTPEYIWNIPARLKNTLEWLTQDGCLKDKSVIPMTYTPAQGRGSKALQSLIWSLQALEANILPSVTLSADRVDVRDKSIRLLSEDKEILSTVFSMV